jgi:mannose-6-phosphate isomerase-like protein (cupin superfamily)
MKKKTMQFIFVLLFIAGIMVGYLLPGDVRSLTKIPLQANVFDVPKRLGQLDQQIDYFKYTVLASTETGSIELIRLDDKIPMHMHPKENHFVYVFKGRAKGTVGDVTAEVTAGQLVAIPAGVPHSFERVGDTPVEIILFSTPPFVPADIVWLENK